MDDDKTGAYVQPPSGSFSSWENTMCNPLGSMWTQTQDAWNDGYGSAKVKREWVGLTDDEIAILWKATPLVVGVYGYTDIAREVEAKLKEKNT